MERLAKKYQNKPFSLLMVNIGESKEQVVSYLANREANFTVLLDPEGYVSRKYKVYGIPAAFLIDTQGRVVFESSGYHDWESKEMSQLLDSLIDQQADRKAQE